MSLMMLGDWKPLSLNKVPRSIHDHYVPDAWVERVMKHEERDEIIIEFDPETSERLGRNKFHLWKKKPGGPWYHAQSI